MIERRLGPFEDVREVARGGQGVVYRARQRETGREVALKRLHALDRDFDRELLAVAPLAHVGIVDVYGVEETEEGPVLWMEWVDGVPIDAWARSAGGRRRSVRELVAVFLALCDAVQHAHGRGVVHRDLKPSNVLVDDRDRPRVLDFGLARLLEDEESETPSDAFAGTPAYAPPEALAGDATSRPDVLGDVHALGVLLYEVLAGRRPWTASAPGELLRRKRGDRPPALAGMRDDADRELDLVLGKALAPERAERYASVAAFAGDLRRWLAGEPLVAHPPGAWYTLRKLARKNPVPAGLAAALVLVLAALTLQVRAHAGELRSERDLALEAERSAKREEARALDAGAAAELEAEAARAALAAAEDAREEAERERDAARAAADEARRARDEAERAARRTEDLVAVLLDTVVASGHALVRSTGRADLERLDEIAPRVEEVFADRPDLRAELHRQLYGAYARAGRSEDALAMAERAAALVDELYPGETVERMNALRDLGTALHRARRRSEALPVFERAVAIVRGPGFDATMRTTLLSVLASTYADQGRIEEALEIGAEALERSRDPSVQVSLGLLVRTEVVALLRRAGRREEALRLSREGLALATNTLGQRSLEAGLLHLPLAEDAILRGEVIEAYAHARPAHEILREHYPLRHGTRVQATLHFGYASWQTGRHAEAVGALRELEELLLGSDRVVGPIGRCQGLWVLGSALLRTGAAEEAEPVLRAAHARALEHFEPGSSEEVRVVRPLVRCLADLGRPDEAFELLLSAERAFRARRVPTGRRFSADLADLARGHLDLGEVRAADRRLEEAVATLPLPADASADAEYVLHFAIRVATLVGDRGRADRLRIEQAARR